MCGLWLVASVVGLVACGEVKSGAVDAPGADIDAAVSDGPSLDAPPNTVALTVALGGTATGRITSEPSGIDCGVACVANYPPGTLVTLTAAPAAGAGFTGWSGACGGALPTCPVPLGSAAAVVANFDTLRHVITVTTVGNGTGTVTAASVGINCPGTCMATVDHGTSVTLTAAAQSGSTFLGWSGACTGTGVCTLTVEGAVQLSAAFGQSQSLIVSKSGNGMGTVTSVPAGINCGAACAQVYAPGTSVTLTASPSAESVFAGWTGACMNATGTCTTTINGATSVNAIFNLRQFTLTVSKSGSGVGTVTSTTAGINCGTDCTEPYAAATMVTLVASPGADTNFAGWGGDCTNLNGPCTVTMSAARNVIARFDATSTVVLTLSIRGGGTLRPSPGPQAGPTSCTSVGENMTTCTLTYARDTTISVTASPQITYMFSDWSGCTPSGLSCSATLASSTTIGGFFCITGTC